MTSNPAFNRTSRSGPPVNWHVRRPVAILRDNIALHESHRLS
jgi:hypothetical protein